MSGGVYPARIVFIEVSRLFRAVRDGWIVARVKMFGTDVLIR
jgi:hypothetical protein